MGTSRADIDMPVRMLVLNAQNNVANHHCVKEDKEQDILAAVAFPY
jgi:hypothetical protein